ncbi:MAG: DNA polymerase III subunit beta [Candidatus Pacebacteria bacterium]|nr:DNA polymerase III subunit beta [Candidatus Paceibacterota bacterium]
MNIECVKEKLVGAISKAEKITSKNPTLPVLKCLLLEAKGGHLNIKATNLDLGVEIVVPAKVIQDGVIAVPGAILNGFLSNLPPEKSIKLEMIDGSLKVSTSQSHALIKTYPIEDYPTIPKVSGGQVFSLPGKDFIKGLKSVWYSSAISSMKPELSSVLIKAENGFMVYAATDAFRLAEKKIKAKNIGNFTQTLIPFRNVAEIVRIFDGVEGDFEIKTDANQVSISTDSIYLFSRAVEGVFPDYRQIIPKETTTEVVLLKQDILNSLKTSTVFSNAFNEVNLEIDPTAKIFHLTTKNNDVGENENSLSAALTGESLKINFNYKYLHDCFQSIDTDSISFSFAGLNKALIIKGVNDQSFMYLVMPMNK